MNIRCPPSTLKMFSQHFLGVGERALKINLSGCEILVSRPREQVENSKGTTFRLFPYIKEE
jgi:hypothetical protein